MKGYGGIGGWDGNTIYDLRSGYEILDFDIDLELDLNYSLFNNDLLTQNPFRTFYSQQI